METLAAKIVEVVFGVVLAAIRQGRKVREALAEGLEEAAAKIRSGELQIDDAVERAREDQADIDALYPNRGKGD